MGLDKVIESVVRWIPSPAPVDTIPARFGIRYLLFIKEDRPCYGSDDAQKEYDREYADGRRRHSELFYENP